MRSLSAKMYATGKIINSSGKAVYSKTVHPGTTAYTIGHIDEAMKFAKLSPGNYTYKLTAKDSKGKTVTATHKFNVATTNTTTKVLGFATVSKPASTDETSVKPVSTSTTTAKPAAKPAPKPAARPAAAAEEEFSLDDILNEFR